MGLLDFLKRRDTSQESGLTLVIDSEGDHFATEHPSWDEVAEAVDAIQPAASPVLIRADGSQLRADGARGRFTIVFRAAASDEPLVIGRPQGGKKRGRPEVQDDVVLVTPFEWWSHQDGAEVFEIFYKGGDVASKFVLRDPRVPLSPDQINALLVG